jgi:hypothetical protein
MNDLENIMSDYERHRQAGAKLNEGNKVALFDVLAAASITEEHVDFDGEGDIGQINSVGAFRGEEAAKLPMVTVTIQTVFWGSIETVTTESSRNPFPTCCSAFSSESVKAGAPSQGPVDLFQLYDPFAHQLIDGRFHEWRAERFTLPISARRNFGIDCWLLQT